MAFGYIAAVLCLLLAEGALRLVGIGYGTSYFVAHDAETLVTNRKFGWRFMPRSTATQPWPTFVRREKPAGTRRVFVLGESAAQGTPSPAFGFPRILQVLLEKQFPTQRVEVVNVAMRGINSHAIQHIARECRALGPDLFLVYMGNNEAIGTHAPEPGHSEWLRQRWILQTVDALKTWRLGQLISGWVARPRVTPVDPAAAMEEFRQHRLAPDDPVRESIYRNFRANLGVVCDVAEQAGAPVLLCTVAVNLKDFPPLASLHGHALPPDRLASWEQAWKAGQDAESRGRSARRDHELSCCDFPRPGVCGGALPPGPVRSGQREGGPCAEAFRARAGC